MPAGHENADTSVSFHSFVLVLWRLEKIYSIEAGF